MPCLNFGSLENEDTNENNLLDKDINTEELQKYVVTIDVYNGTNTTEDFAVIKRADGEWDYQTDED